MSIVSSLVTIDDSLFKLLLRFLAISIVSLVLLQPLKIVNVEIKIKVSDNSAKITNPGFKKIVRIYDKASGKAEADLIMLKDEVIDVTKPLTITHPLETWKKTTFTNYEIRELSVKIVENGKLIYKMPTLKEIAKYSKTEMESFWDEYLRIDAPHIFKVDLSDKLLTLKTDMLEKIRKGNLANGK